MYGINDLQTRIMSLVDYWVRSNKTPVPHKEIMQRLTNDDHIAETTAKAAIKVLISKGYIRKAVCVSNKTYYVQLRTLFHIN